MKKLTPYLLIAALAAALSGCSETVKVSVVRYDSDAVLSFGVREFFGRRLKPLCLRLLEVREQGSAMIVWHVKRSEAKCIFVSKVRVGDPLAGFQSASYGLPLDKHKKYVAYVLADEGSGSVENW